jgi:hypothetical protein
MLFHEFLSLPVAGRRNTVGTASVLYGCLFELSVSWLGDILLIKKHLKLLLV